MLPIWLTVNHNTVSCMGSIFYVVRREMLTAIRKRHFVNVYIENMA